MHGLNGSDDVSDGLINLVDLLLLIDRELTWAHVDQQDETAAVNAMLVSFLQIGTEAQLGDSHNG